MYIGQTGRTLQHNTTSALSNTSAAAEHAMKTKHSIDWTGARVIESWTTFSPTSVTTELGGVPFCKAYCTGALTGVQEVIAD